MTTKPATFTTRNSQRSQSLSGATIVFDLDGTLVDTAPDLIRATQHTLQQQGLKPVAPEAVLPWISYGARRMIVQSLDVLGEQGFDETTIDKMFDEFLSYYEANIADESRPFPHILDRLDDLKRQGCRLAVCTNKREDLAQALLKTLEMNTFFEAIAGRDTFPVCKPDPQHLMGTIAMASGNTTHAVMIGDSHVDVETAHAANVPSIGVTFGYTQVPIEDAKPSLILDDYTTLVDAVETLITKANA